MVILGAMLRNACFLKNYDYVLEILHTVKGAELQPSSKFLQIVYEFNGKQFRSLQGRTCTQRDRNEYFRFSREFKQWKKDMAIEEGKEAMEKKIKTADGHPWKQFKEPRPTGVENVKNVHKFKKPKTKHRLYKLTENRLNTISEKHSKTADPKLVGGETTKQAKIE